MYFIAFVSKIMLGKIKILKKSENNGNSVFWIQRRK